MICFYHDDADGRCAGAIVYKYIQEEFPNTSKKFIKINYGWPIPFEIIEPNEQVYIVDFHFSVEDMKKLFDITPNVKVFDHHKSAAEVVNRYPDDVWVCLDPDGDFAGCELVWLNLFFNEEMPIAIKLIADRDKWAWKYGSKTAKFNTGLKLYSHHPEDEIWNELLDDEGNRDILDEITDSGTVCIQYRDSLCKEFREEWGFEALLDGYKCYVINLLLRGSSSEAFGDKLKEYDVCAAIVYCNGTWKVSLRSEKVDVSEIAKKFPGGGGHANSAGFEGVKELPFLRC